MLEGCKGNSTLPPKFLTHIISHVFMLYSMLYCMLYHTLSPPQKSFENLVKICYPSAPEIPVSLDTCSLAPYFAVHAKLAKMPFMRFENSIKC